MLVAAAVSETSSATPRDFKYVTVSSFTRPMVLPVPTMSKSGAGSSNSNAANVSGVMSRRVLGDHAAWSSSYAKMLPTQYVPLIANPRAS